MTHSGVRQRNLMMHAQFPLPVYYSQVGTIKKKLMVKRVKFIKVRSFFGPGGLLSFNVIFHADTEEIKGPI